jgi:colanic acid/amylovoran biosynthesis glycosyltransferase
MQRIGFLTTRFLDLSETFIYEPLMLMQTFTPYVYALQRRNTDNFPYPEVAIGKAKFLVQKMVEQKIELLHAHYGYMGVFALPFKKKLDIPLITSFYGLDVYQHTKSPLYRWQLRQLFKRGDLFLTCSQKMRQDLIALGAAPSRTRVLYGGADLQKFAHVSLPPLDKELTILMCGRFVEKKGFIYGVRAFLQAAQVHENIRLKIIGSGNEEPALRALVAASPFAAQVTFLGNKSHEEYIEEIKRCHIFMAPSVTAKSGDSEGLPTVLIEAAAIGRPLIASRHSGIPEIVHDQQNGFIVDEKDVAGLAKAIQTLVADPALCEEFARYGRAYVEKMFNFETQVKILEKMYAELLGRLTN